MPTGYGDTMNTRHAALYRPLPEDPAPDGGAPNGGAGGNEWTPPASQVELDRIISDRITRERAKFADYEDLKSKAAAHDKAIEDAKDEQQKAVDAARTEGAQSVLTTANARLVDAEARALAAEAHFRNPTLATRAIDLSGIKVGDDGNVDQGAIKALLATLAESEPYLVDDGKGRPAPDRNQGLPPGEKPAGMAAGREMYKPRNTSTN